MRIGRKTPKKEKATMSVSLYGNLFFVVLELGMAIYTSSQAVLLDAVYDGIEFFMLLPSVFLIPLLYKPSNEKHPFGYMQIETVFIVVKGITMTAVTIGLIANSMNIVLHGGRVVSFDTVAGFELTACLIGIAVTLYLKYRNSTMNSPLIQAEMQAAAFFLPTVLPFPWIQALVPYLDSILTIILSMIMLPMPIKTVISGIRDLLLISPGEETIQEIRELVEPELRGCRYSDLYYEVVKTGRKLWISVYITLEKDELSVRRFKIYQKRCISALAQKYTDFYFELLPEIELDPGELEEIVKEAVDGEGLRG